MTKTTAEPTHQHVAKAQQLVRHLADVHQLGGKQKQWHRQQYVAVVKTVEYLLGRGSKIELCQQKIEDRAGDHGIANWQSQQAKAKNGANRDRKRTVHRADPLPIWILGGWPCMARQVKAA